tara:strand:+ start:109 stop:1215 length:1107 start_codon:yes stop_codon:yes gene_type:complete
MENNSDISFKNIINEIIYKKYIGLVIFLLVLSFGILYAVYIDKDRWRGNLDIKLLSSTDYDPYEGLKNFDDVYILDQSILRNLLIEEIVDRSEAREILAKVKNVGRDSFSSDLEYYTYLQDLTYDFSVSFITKQDYEAKGQELDIENQDLYRLSYVTDSPEEISEVFNYILVNSNEKVRLFLKENFLSRTKLYESNLKLQMENIEITINGLKNINKLKKEQRIQYLKNQAEIAKSLDVIDNSVYARSLNDGSAITLEMPYFLRGYDAISKELSLLIEDTSIQFVPEIFEAIQELEVLKSDVTLKRINETFQNTFIEDQELFKAATYNVSEIRLKKLDTPSVDVMIISFLIAAFLYISLILLLIVSRSR